MTHKNEKSCFVDMSISGVVSKFLNSDNGNDVFKLHNFSIGLMCIKEMEEEELRATDMAFSVPSSTGQEIHLSNKYSRITPENKSEYIRLAMNYR